MLADGLRTLLASRSAFVAEATMHNDLLDSASSEDDGDGSPAFHVNEEYARRFEVRRRRRRPRRPLRPRPSAAGMSPVDDSLCVCSTTRSAPSCTGCKQSTPSWLLALSARKPQGRPAPTSAPTQPTRAPRRNLRCAHAATAPCSCAVACNGVLSGEHTVLDARGVSK